MQAAVPFTWEERPGKPKQRPRKLQCSSKVSDLQPCASTGDYDFRNPEKMFSLQELFSKDSIRSSSTTNKERFCLTPPPRLRYASGMSSSSSQSRSFSTPESPTCSPEADDDEDCSKKCKQEAGKRPWHARTRSVTLLDLIKTGNRDEIEPCHSRDHHPQGEKTLGELFKSDTPKESKGLPVRHKVASDPFMGSARRRSSYLPYKQGLLSIFCMSPYKHGLLRCASPAGNHSRKYR